jgi:hypothetical protein
MFWNGRIAMEGLSGSGGRFSVLTKGAGSLVSLAA